MIAMFVIEVLFRKTVMRSFILENLLAVGVCVLKGGGVVPCSRPRASLKVGDLAASQARREFLEEPRADGGVPVSPGEEELASLCTDTPPFCFVTEYACERITVGCPCQQTTQHSVARMHLLVGKFVSEG